MSSQSQTSCCVPGCSIGPDVRLHHFPNPETEIERFRTWVLRIGGHIIGLENNYIFKNRRVCSRHFEPVFVYSRRLSKTAIPTLKLGDHYDHNYNNYEDTEEIIENGQQLVAQDVTNDHRYSRKRQHEDHSYFTPKVEEKQPKLHNTGILNTPPQQVPPQPDSSIVSESTALAINQQQNIDVTMHSFPNPNKSLDRFKTWVTLVGGKLETKADFEYYRKIKVCDIHFTSRDRNRYNRLNAQAVPSLHLTGTHRVLHGFPNPEKERERFTSWLYAIKNLNLLGLPNEHIFKYRRVCRSHFEDKYLCRNNKISNIAVPTLNLALKPSEEAEDDSGKENTYDEQELSSPHELQQDTEEKTEIHNEQIRNSGPVFECGSCRCCGETKRCRLLTAEYCWRGSKEVYADMLRDCFGLVISNLDGEETERLICATCVARLREAGSFYRQVLRCEERLLQATIHLHTDEADAASETGDVVENEPQEVFEIQFVVHEPNTDFDSDIPEVNVEEQCSVEQVEKLQEEQTTESDTTCKGFTEGDAEYRKRPIVTYRKRKLSSAGSQSVVPVLIRTSPVRKKIKASDKDISVNTTNIHRLCESRGQTTEDGDYREQCDSSENLHLPLDENVTAHTNEDLNKLDITGIK